MRYLIGILVLALFVVISQNAIAQYEPAVEGVLFDARYEIHDDTQAKMTVSEKIVVDFNQPRRGILRYIPTEYDNGILSAGTQLNTTVVGVQNSLGDELEYATYTESDNLVIKIGNAEIYLQGRQEYNIKYSVENFIKFFDGYDELFWDINGDGWDFGFESVAGEFVFPKVFDDFSSIQESRCFSGSFGSTLQQCTIKSEDLVYRVESTSAVGPYENISFLAKLSPGYFEPPSFLAQYGALILRNIGILLPFVVASYMLWRWKKYGRDPKGRGVIIPEYQPPEDLSAAEVGTVVDFSVDNSEISATIIDLAIRRYLKIIDNAKTDIAKDRKYEFVLQNSDWKGLQQHEKEILEGLFPDRVVGKTVKAADLKNKFHKSATAAKDAIDKELIAKMYFPKSPKKVKRNYAIFGGVLIAIGVLILQSPLNIYLGWGIGFILAGLVVNAFAIIMPIRTKKGVLINEKILGLKQYMAIAEKDRIKMMQSPESPYNKSDEPDKSVELYETLLPFAIVLGVENEWSKKFANIYSQPPDWYQGNYNTFTTMALASRLSNGVNNLNTSVVAAPKSSSSSGFSSGGGFSGGGFGGGGGGSW